MPATRFVREGNNLAAKASTTLINGNGAYANAPPLVQVAGGPMSNALDTDSRRAWSIPQYSSAMVLQLDLGSQQMVRFVSLHGVEIPFAFPNRAVVLYRTQTQGYQGGFVAAGNVNYAGWTQAGYVGLPASGTGRSGCLVLPAAVGMRYITLHLEGTAYTAVNVGKVVIASALESVSNPRYGHSVSVNKTASVIRTLGGAPIVTYMGPDTQRWKLPFQVTTQEMYALVTMFKEQRPFTYIDHNDSAYDVIPSSNTLECTSVFNDLWDVSFEVEET